MQENSALQQSNTGGGHTGSKTSNDLDSLLHPHFPPKQSHLTAKQKAFSYLRTLPFWIKIFLKLPYIPIRWTKQKIKFFLLENEIKRFLRSNTFGIRLNPTPPKIPLIISLTSYPKRFYQLHYTLYSIMKQSYKADKIILWLSKQECPNGRADVPKHILEFEKCGLEIAFSDENLRPYNKIIHTIRAYPQSCIITFDDDIFYPDFIVKRLVESYEKFPKDVHCHWVGYVIFDKDGVLEDCNNWLEIFKYQIPPRSSYRNFLFGVGGVLYPPHCLHKDVVDSEIFMRLAPTSDDIWLWAMALLQGTKIRLIENHDPDSVANAITTWGSQENALWKYNATASQKHLDNILAYYPQILEILKPANLKAKV
ncbi:glycosyltransferase family A protein [Helicobacter equorum]|uniref:glycosyltransferase family A protein n=1 Tax=Helicobacter equorum TaxID=361872 RepID=UPI003620E484